MDNKSDLFFQRSLLLGSPIFSERYESFLSGMPLMVADKNMEI